MSTRLSVNVNKIATLRNARGGNNPDIVSLVKKIEDFGADGITVHPRQDERHITLNDAYDISKVVTTEYNICLLYTSPSPRDVEESRMPSSA